MFKVPYRIQDTFEQLVGFQGSYQAAVDAYLDISPTAAHDTQKLAPAWQAAVRLASQHLPAAVQSIAARAAQNLVAAKLPEAAASLLSSYGDKRGAVKLYCQAGLLGKARALASGDQSLEEFVAETVASGVTPGADGGAGLQRDEGGSVAELDELARRGNWAQVGTHFAILAFALLAAVQVFLCMSG